MTRLARRRGKKLPRYRRARIRHFLFTVGPHRVSGGRITRRHLAQEIVVREMEMASPLWPSEFDGLRIGHVSDFHLGELLPLDKAVEIVECLGEQQPDLVACTGDLVDLEHVGAGPLLEAMGGLEPPLGTFLVLGNHDELHDPDTLTGMAVDSGLTVLRNEGVNINRNGSRLLVAGIDWARSAVACARQVDLAGGEQAHLLLAHNPKAFLRATDLGVPLTLAGHTHGGQIAMKKRPNANLALTHRRSAGFFQSNGSLLYVTSGVGAWFPLRVNCPAEIAMLTVRHEEEGTEGLRD
ncbi:MAG: metallophosphoesterase [Planctomycetota bacterium]|jgi:predicted MPP superfamily phosphohydrolase